MLEVISAIKGKEKKARKKQGKQPRKAKGAAAVKAAAVQAGGIRASSLFIFLNARLGVKTRANATGRRPTGAYSDEASKVSQAPTD